MRRLGVVCFGLLIGSCTDPNPPSAVPAALTVAMQPGAQAQSGAPLAPAPVVALLDGAGNRVATRGVLISASLASGTGAVSGTLEVRTDATGLASFTDLRIIGPVGTKTLRFAAAGLTAAGSNPIDLAAGAAATITPEAGNNQTAPAGTALTVAPATRIVDGAGNPVPNVAVTFVVTTGGGSVEGGATPTGADGVARVARWALGPVVGSNTLTATAGSLQLVFSATGTVGPPAKITIVEGDGQTAVIGNPVTTLPAVKVTDAFDNPASGVTVTFTAGSGGSVTGGIPQTDLAGIAKVGGWTLGFAPGTQSLVASRTGVPSATFGSTATHFAVQSLSVGGFTSCAVTPAGNVYCWGDNSAGQVGDSTVQNTRSLPTLVKAGALTFASVVVGGGHTCAVTAGGQAHCWGNNFSGQLGDGTGISKPVPVAVAGGHLFQSVVAGDVHTCGLKADGTAWCWGGNGNGRVGDSTVVPRGAPVAVKGGLVYAALAAGASHTCGLTTAGLLFCWGSNAGGRLGDGTTTDRLVPTAVAAAGTTFLAVSAGGFHTCAIATGGTAVCWGAGTAGALGTGNTAGQLTPVAVSGTATYTRIGAAAGHTCAITTAGAVQCWGANGNGRLGDGTTASRSVPTAVAATFSATVVTVGDEHSCALAQAGSAICWGRDAEGQLGIGGSTAMPRPVGVKSP